MGLIESKPPWNFGATGDVNPRGKCNPCGDWNPGVGGGVDPNWKCSSWLVFSRIPHGEKSSKRFKKGILRAQHLWILPGSQR